MNDGFLKLNIDKQEASHSPETTLVISSVPSQILYDIVTEMLAKGEDISSDRVREQIVKRSKNGCVYFDYSELEEYLKKEDKIETIGPSTSRENEQFVALHEDEAEIPKTKMV